MIHKIGKQFKEMGRDIFLRGFISSHAGNMSIRVKDKIYITRRSSMLGRLQQKDVIELKLGQDNSQIPMASSELIVHTAIYKATRTMPSYIPTRHLQLFFQWLRTKLFR